MPNFVYFGTSLFATIVLDALQAQGIVPTLIITTPDKPQGRKLLLTPSPVKVWAQENNIPFLQPEKLKDESFLNDLTAKAPHGSWDLFVVASYGKIIPHVVLDIPAHKTLNIHPSLLPLLRGPSPIQTAIMEDMQETGVTIMRLDAEMDHGPIIAQEKMKIEPWPQTTIELEHLLGTKGGEMLAQIIPKWIAGTIPEQEQHHSLATFTKKIEKADGLIDLAGDAYKNFLKIQAFSDWPKPYFFIEKDGKHLRVVIAKASYTDNTLTLERVIPEGKSEMSYSDFAKGYLK